MSQDINSLALSQTQKHIVYLSLGSNLKDRQCNLQIALQKLQPFVHIQRISSVYETEPVGYLDQPSFFNIVCLGDTLLTAKELLTQIKLIEKELGRQPTIRNGPRLIDIDILFYDTCIYADEHLILPHPRIRERAFVLIPLVEISPTVIDPQSGCTAQELLHAISQAGVTKTSVHV